MTITAVSPVAESSGRSASSRTYLMCEPNHFTVSYRINPWMHPSQPTDTALAHSQWSALRDTYLALGHTVHLIDPAPGLPDMVFAANGGLTIDGIAYTARFAHDERAAEGGLYADWFASAGFEVVEAHEVNEGEGDFLLAGERILAATGFRSSAGSHDELRRVFGREVVSLRLVDPRFYHLDTALTVLDPAAEDPTIAYFPPAFDGVSRRRLRELYPSAIEVGESDALWLGLNAASDGLNVVIAARAEGFGSQLEQRGYRAVPLDLSELLRGGGGVKCCTLELRR